jgi:hypothetical protein
VRTSDSGHDANTYSTTFNLRMNPPRKADIDIPLVAGRAGDMFFVLIWKNSPSERMNVITMLKKIVYDTFEQ